MKNNNITTINRTVNLSHTVFPYLGEIIRCSANSRIVKSFDSLSQNEKEEIIAQTFLKQFCRKFNMINYKFNVDDTTLKVNYPVKVSVKGTTMDGRMFSNKTTVISESLIIKILQIHNSKIEYLVEFNSSEYDEQELLSRVKPEILKDLREFHFKIADADKTALKVASDSSYWVEKLPKTLNYKTQDKRLLADFFDVMKAHGFTRATGSEIVCLKEIYPVALKAYPLFAKLSLESQMELFEKAYTRACSEDVIGRDIYLFARTTFEEFVKMDLHKSVVIKNRLYERVKEYRHDRYLNGRCYQRNAIKTILYEYTIGSNLVLKSTFIPADLWRVLVPEKDNNTIVT